MKKRITLPVLISAIFYFLPGTAQIISTVAGNHIAGYSGDGGPATAAELHGTLLTASDSAGNLYIVDAVKNVVRKVNTAGIISTFAGTGAAGFSGDGGLATAATFNSPSGVALDSHGNVYVTDILNSVIRKINTSGIISTIAGNRIPGYSGDGGPATAAEIENPYFIAFDKSDNMYYGDYNNVVRKISSSGIITTIAGMGGKAGYSGDGGPATAAELNTVYGITCDDTGNVYFNDVLNYRIRKISISGIITTYAGTGVNGFSGDGGPAISAKIYNYYGMEMDPGNNLYFKQGSNYVRKITNTGIIEYVAGIPTSGYSGDGGPATAAEFRSASFGNTDKYGDIFICDEGNYVIRKIQGLGGNDTLTGYAYIDNNHNCIYDGGDTPLANMMMKLMHNGHLYSGAMTDVKGKYEFFSLPARDTFNIELDSASCPGYIISCPVTGIITDTSNSRGNNFALNCNGGFDMGGTLSICVYNSVSYSTATICACLDNYRCKSTNGSLRLVLDTAIHPLYFYNTNYTVSGDTLTWAFDTVGPTHTQNTCIQVLALIDSLPAGDSIRATFMATPVAGDSVPANNAFTYWIKPSTTYCLGYPYDPNGKTVSPVGDISPNQKLTYNIHFQNTGTATATNVDIFDTLSPYLDVTTLHILNSSSPMTTSIISGNIIRFSFWGINLVDSTVSRTKSVGTFSYSILPLATDPIGTIITNRADIYFDKNPAILTNTTSSKITSVTTALQDITSPSEHILCFPNPFHNITSVVVNDDGKHYLELFDLAGRKLQSIEYTGKQYDLSAEGLAKGMYFIRVSDKDKNLIGTSKIVVQ